MATVKWYATMTVVITTITMIAGCNNNGQKQADLVDPLEMANRDDLQRNTEVQLVEQMAQYRQSYRQHLELLKQFYDKQGNHLKMQWTQQELDGLRTIPQRTYLTGAETAGPHLKATTDIVEADVMYEQAMDYYKKGRGKLGLFTNKKKLYLAKDKFNELIATFPNSDKIDDAAFHIAEICNLYLKDYTTALIYYQRTWQWDPQTPWPARFAMAVIYDEHFHDLIKAMEYYEQAIKLEAACPDVVMHSKNRLQEITRELEEN